MTTTARKANESDAEEREDRHDAGQSQDAHGYSLHGLDGEIGKVKDFYFDDRDWTIRYLVADTGEWLVSRQVLISPHSLAGVDRDQGSITVKLTKDQIEHSPDVE